jgi:hypothetical protein
VITMATSDYDRDRVARDHRTTNPGMSATGIIMGIVVAALLIGFVAFTFTDRSAPGSSATSPPTTTTAPRTTTPRSNTTTTTPTTPAPTPSTR